MIQVCEAEGIIILKGVVSKDHVYMHINYRSSQYISDIVKKIKGKSSIKLKQEFLDMRKRYWGKIYMLLIMVVGVSEI